MNGAPKPSAGETSTGTPTPAVEAPAPDPAPALDAVPDLSALAIDDDVDSHDIRAIGEAVAGNAAPSAGVSSLSASNLTITAGSVNMQGAPGMVNGNGDLEAIGEAIQDRESNGDTEQHANSENTSLEEDIQLLTGDTDTDGKKKPFFTRVKDGINDFNNLPYREELLGAIGGAASEMHKGLHSITDTLYVDGGASQDWKSTAATGDALLKSYNGKTKEMEERKKANWANNKTNISMMTELYMPEFREKMQKKYEGTGKPQSYIESQAREAAEQKAKAALKDMSAYVPYGVTDVKLAYDLYKDANQYGLKPEQAIKKRAGFERFDKHPENIANINANVTIEGDNHTSVSAAIPNAREYYNNGYHNVNDMVWVDYMAERLGKTPQFAMQIDEALKKKGGKIGYNGSSKELKTVIDQINKHYGG